MTQSLAVNGPISMEIIIIGLNQYVIRCNLTMQENYMKK